MLLPSFHDTHSHPVDMVLSLMRCDLFEDYGKEEYLQHIEECAQIQEDKENILGVGFWLGSFDEGDRPNRNDLDKIIPDKPAWFMDTDGHAFWVNSKTLEIAGIDKDTPDPESGIIERDEETGEPGVILNTA